MELFHLYLFATIANVVDCLNFISFFWLNVTLFFHEWTATHILQFSSPTVPLNFVWLSHNVLLFFLKLQTSLFPFISYVTDICCADCRTFSPLFLSATAPPFFLWASHKCPECLHYLCMNVVTHVRLQFFLCESRTNILVSPLLISGH